MAKRKRLNIVSINKTPIVQQSIRDEELESSENQRQNQSFGKQFDSGNASTNEGESSEPSVSANAHSSQASGVAKKVRGPTQKLGIWELKGDSRIAVKFNDMAQPIGEEGNELTQFLGTLVKMSSHVGINFDEWRDVSYTTKETLWSIVKEKFKFLPAETRDVKKWIIANMGSKWKSWKNTLKERNYDPALTVDEMVTNETDKRVNKSQFKELVKTWVDPEFQAMCEVKKRSRSKNKEPHITGSKSFARLAEEEATKNNGVLPTRGKLFIRTRTRKNGTIINSAATAVVEALHNVMNEENDIQDSEGPVDYRNDDLAKVKGPEKRGRIRCVGFTVMKDKCASSSQQPQVPIQDPQVPILQAQVSTLSRKFDMLLGAFKKNLPHEQLCAILNDLNNEVIVLGCKLLLVYMHIWKLMM
ncbi:unnamed protein product [Cuscuta epithymum]|uniref:Transposase, Ptta/En/Spm, plant n=1 Tax=Cuscuta epithymum TaxID=186058 RepID=A0AAV0FSL9_9ASTE|nr:unnamed protein product [Cuscuta epithymum]